ncbi:hypothetical protein N008_15810 [Hymenobacter sp. APR13]|nr:hypothetical protein N008_15810 [Hymenobacter sp. APR13]
MNGFTINCDSWYVDLFAFDRDEGLNDTDWLADDSYPAAVPLPITGLEDIQAIYENYAEKWEDAAGEEAAHDCAALILLRVQELFNAAKGVAAQQLKWATLPIYVTSHDAYIELLYRA